MIYPNYQGQMEKVYACLARYPNDIMFTCYIDTCTYNLHSPSLGDTVYNILY